MNGIDRRHFLTIGTAALVGCALPDTASAAPDTTTALKKRLKAAEKSRDSYKRKYRIAQAKLDKRWKGTHKAWDKRARAELKRQVKLGRMKTSEIELAMWIHHREGGPNSVNDSSKNRKRWCYGGWQLDAPKALKGPWWSPEWSTERAVKYMVGRYGSVTKAHAFKRARGWY